jgi:hypothetical protein
MDLHNNVKYLVAIAPTDPSATGVITGRVIDRSGFDAVEFVQQQAAITATDFVATPIVFAGSATDALASVADADLLGTEAGAALSGATSDNMTGKIGYTGTLRYVRCDLDVENAATGFHAVVCVLGGLRKGPQSDQTV